MRSIADIRIAALKKRGIRGVIFDVDNTLTLHHATEIYPLVAPAFKEICTEFAVVIYSNCEPNRHAELRRIFSVPIVEPGLKKPKRAGFARARELLGLPTDEIAVIGDRALTDILGGNRSGCYTILVDPLGADEPLLLTQIRSLERWRLRLAGVK